MKTLSKLIRKVPKIELNSYPYMYTDVRDDDYRVICPTCGEEVDDFKNAYRCKCGQRLDWRKFYEWNCYNAIDEGKPRYDYIQLEDWSK